MRREKQPMENREPKKIFSINLAAYIMATTGVVPDFAQEDETQMAYMVFPESAEVTAAIRTYKRDNPSVLLHDFIKAIKQIREYINTKRDKGERV